MEDWEHLSNRWRDDLDARIATLQALRERLTTCIAADASRSTGATCSTPTTKRPGKAREPTTSRMTGPERKKLVEARRLGLGRPVSFWP